MKKLFIGLVAVIIPAVISIVSCNKTEHAVSPHPVTDSGEVLLGVYNPFSLIMDQGNTAKVGFLQSARPFQLDIGTKEGNVYKAVLEKAIKENIPVEVYVHKNTAGITKVKPAAELSLSSSRRSLLPFSIEDNLPVIPNEATLNSLFNWLRSAHIPFAYSPDGCYARAHKMRQMLLAVGYDCAKLFAYGDLAASNAFCCVSWSYHVAPAGTFQECKRHNRTAHIVSFTFCYTGYPAAVAECLL